MNALAGIASATIMMMASTASTNAQQAKIVSPAGLDVIVWKRTSVQKVLALLHAKNFDVDEFLPLVACEVRSGTAAVVVSRRTVFYDVKILEGPQSGCRGAVAQKMVVTP